MEYKVLVLLASHNGFDWIKNQIDSILNQENIEVHIFISDDFSTDQTLAELHKHYYQSPKVTILDNTSKMPFGSAAANFRRLIIDSNSFDYDYVALSDQDDIWFASKIYNAINAIKNSNSHGYSSAVIAFWSNDKSKLIKQSPKIKKADFLFEGAGQGCTFVLPADVFKLVQDFFIKYEKEVKDFYYHDWLVYLLIRSWGGFWFFDKIPSMYYRQHQNNDTGSRGTISSIVKRFDKIKKGWYKKQISIAISLYHLAAIKKNPIILDFSLTFNQPDSIKRRFKLANFVWRNGRRRLVDRFVLVVSSLLGYI